jgi:hypothetical protein
MYIVYTANEGPERIQYKCLVPIYVFQEMKLNWPASLFQNYNVLSSNFHIHVSLSDLCIPRIGQPIELQPNRQTNPGIYKSLTDTWMCELGWGCTVSFLGIHKSEFRYSAVLDIHGSLSWRILKCSAVLLKAIHPFTIQSSSGDHSQPFRLYHSQLFRPGYPVRSSECTREERILLEMKLGA